MPIKVCSEAYFFQVLGFLTSLKSQIREHVTPRPPRPTLAVLVLHEYVYNIELLHEIE